MTKINKVITLFLFFSIYILEACKEEKLQTVLELFPEATELAQKKDYNINKDSLAVIQGLYCDGHNLVVYDVHSDESYTLFDEQSGQYLARFGRIGQGPAEILRGGYGYLFRRCFSVFNDRSRVVMKYNLDFLRSGKIDATLLTKYDIPDARVSRLIAIDDSTFLGMGTYQSHYQYFLFDKNNKVLDYGVEVYNAADSTFEKYTKYLSNQGDLVMNPKKRVFASSLNFSSNIDFFEISNNKIKLIKSLRLGDPISKPMIEVGRFFSVDPTEDTQIGYIHLSATDKNVYALYTDKKVYESPRKSNVVLVFDWEGNPVKKYVLDKDAHYIAVDDEQKSLFAAVVDSEGGWTVICYRL